MNADLARWLIVLIAGLDVVLMTAGSIKRWDTFTPRLRRIIPWVVMTYVTIAYGAAEVAANKTPVPPGLRVPFMALVLLGLFVALVYRIDEDDPSATAATLVR